MTAKIIAIAQAKGGVGKSTLCASLATTFAEKHEVLVIDCDPPQNSLIAWFEQRESQYESQRITVLPAAKPAELLSLINKSIEQFDIILLDGPPHINATTKAMVATANIVLVPLAPSSIEIWSFEQMDQLMQSAKQVNPQCEARIVWTRVRKRVRSSEYLIDDVRKSSHIKPFSAQLTQRVAYLDAYAEGLSVYEWSDHIARTELWALHSALLRVVNKLPSHPLIAKDKALAFARSND